MIYSVAVFSKLVSLSCIVSVVTSLTYDLSCFRESPSDPKLINSLATVHLNYTNLGVPPRPVRQAHYVDGMCGIHVFLYIKNGYVFLQYFLKKSPLQVHCEWQDQEIKSSLPEFTLTSLGHSEFIDDPFLENVPFDLPWDNGMIMHTFFPHLVAEGRITGICTAALFSQFGGDSATPKVSYTIEINGCPSRMYGARCSNACNCTQNIQCHSFNGACICPKGFAGDYCEKHDPYLEIGVESLYIKWGTPLTVNCTAYGFTQTNLPVIWKRNNTVLKNTTRRYLSVDYVPRPVQLAYHINNVTEYYNDVYQCVANQTIIREVNIIVYDLPNPFTKFPTNQTVFCGSNITLTCQVRAHAGTVKWTRNTTSVNDGTVIRNNTGNFTIYLNPITGESKLTKIHANIDDEAVYRCFVGHTFEKDDITFAESYVTIVVPPSGEYPMIELDGSTLVVKEDALVSVTCVVYKARPIPELKWKLGDEELNDARQNLQLIETDSLFEIRNTITFPVNREDNLKYLTCRAKSNEFGDAEKSMRLNVTSKPIVKFQPNYVDILEGDRMQVQCIGSSNPTPITYRWECSKPNGDVILIDEQTLSIPDVSTDFDQSSLRCFASNNIGTGSAILKVNVRKRGVPLYAFLPALAVISLLLLVVVPFMVYRHRRRIQRIAHQFTLPEDFKDDKEFDVFISYKGDTDDELFVIKKLVPKLEEMGFAVCVHYKHFVAGQSK
ncbi:uncharacterized protein LOC117118653 [Anneissia japonica]|uniref:uncharacterized protein LOC117118653 n=1 Tax=Anneissia japonica TaxID=1529436 RepID=UPI00142557CB|nr:uncharacterized protein LOC117118653 [Anneissia japonica]